MGAPPFISRMAEFSVFSRVRFAARYVLGHLVLSAVVGALSAAFVFSLLYPAPYRALLGVASIFLLILAADVVCGPLLTFILASPQKSRRERWLDFGLVGLIQLAALAYGLHSVWAARPVVLGFEVDRLVVVTANEIDPGQLMYAPEGLRRLPWWGVHRVGTRRAANGQETLDSVQLGLAGVSPAMRPGWWLPWGEQRAQMSEAAKPLAELIARRPQDAQLLRDAAKHAGAHPASLRYLPLTSSKAKEWVALLDSQMNMVGWAPVDGF